MVAKRSDAKSKTEHPALRFIREQGITRVEAAAMLGIPEKAQYLNLVLDRWRSTSREYARLFHDVFGIPYEELMDVTVRPDAKTFRKQKRKKPS